MYATDEIILKSISRIKNKQNKINYEIIYDHLLYIDYSTIDRTNNYIKDFYAFSNGYVDKQKMWKSLAKMRSAFPHYHYDFLLEYAKYKIKDNNENIKSFDDLIHYSKNHSKLSFILLVLDGNDKNISLISSIGVFDYLCKTLLEYQRLKKENKACFPSVMVFDFNIEFSTDGCYMENDRFIFLWNTIYKHAMEIYNEIIYSLGLIDDSHHDVLNSVLNQFATSLNQMKNDLVNS